MVTATVVAADAPSPRADAEPEPAESEPRGLVGGLGTSCSV